MCELTNERLIVKCEVAEYENVIFSEYSSLRHDIIAEITEDLNAFSIGWSLHLQRHFSSVTMQ